MTTTYRPFVTWIVLFVGSIMYNFYLLKFPVNFYDEGIILTGADRVLKGHLPYLDFWSMYPPGQYFTLALLFKLFGTSILTERVYDIVIRSMISPFVYVFIKKLGLSNAIAIAGWSIALIYLGTFGFPAYPIYPAILLIFFGVYFVVHYMETNQSQHLIYAGIFTTAGALFRHDLAGMAAMSVLLTLIVRHVAGRETCFHPSMSFIFGILLTGLPVSIYLASVIGMPLVVDQLLLTPAEIMPKYRWLPYPTSLSFNSIQFYVYPFTLFAGFFASLFFIFRLRSQSRLSYGMFLLSLVGILFLNQARIRSDSIHLLPAVLLSAMIGPILFYVLYKSLTQNIITQLGSVCGYLLLAMIIVPLAKPIYHKLHSIDSGYFTFSKNSYRLGCAEVSTDLQDLVLFLKKSTNEDDAIYVGVENHDRFIANDVIIYFLTDRPYATKYHELHPGVTNTLAIQNDIIQDIENASVSTMVLAPRYWNEPNATRVDANIDCLDNYIREKYKFTQKFGKYEVWTRKSTGVVARQSAAPTGNTAALVH